MDIDIETLREKKRDSEGSFLRCRCVSPRRRCARLPRSGVRARAFRPRRGEGGAIAATRVHAFGLTARGYLANGDAVLGLASAEKNHADNPHVVMAMALSIVSQAPPRSSLADLHSLAALYSSPYWNSYKVQSDLEFEFGFARRWRQQSPELTLQPRADMQI